jgi:hypothetical protein
LLIFHVENPHKDNLASTRRYTKIHPYPDQVPVYSDPENLVTWRNIKELQTSSFSSNPNVEISPSILYQISKSVYLIDLPEDYLSALELPQEPLIDLHNSPL